MAKSTDKKIEGLKAELEYCKWLVERGHKNPHWAIRVEEITAELNTLKPKKTKKKT